MWNVAFCPESVSACGFCWLVFWDRHKGTVILYVSCVTYFLVAVEKGWMIYFFIVLNKVFELYVLEHFLGCYLVFFLFVKVFCFFASGGCCIMNECIPKQTMYNSASINKAWVSRSEMGHASPFGICLLSEVRFWDAHGLYQADGLRLLVFFQNFLTAPGDSVCFLTTWWICFSAVLLLALLIQGHWEPRICSV